MEKLKLNNLDEVRSAVNMLTHNVNGMCNTQNPETVKKAYAACKELLAAIYNFNVDKFKETSSKK